MAAPAAPCVSLSLPQMVDLALGSPEVTTPYTPPPTSGPSEPIHAIDSIRVFIALQVGSVNFNILHSLLHVMIKQLELQQCAVEFRGPDSERIQVGDVQHASLVGGGAACWERAEGHDVSFGVDKAAMAGSAVPVAKLSEYRVRDRSVRRDREASRHVQQRDDSESSRTVGPLPPTVHTYPASATTPRLCLMGAVLSGSAQTAAPVGAAAAVRARAPRPRCTACRDCRARSPP